MRRTSKSHQILGSLGLTGAALIWGLSFVVVKDSADAVPVLYLVALRYLLAEFAMGVLFFKKLKGLTKEAVRQGMVLGFFLCAGQFFQTLGCKYTTAGKNAFLTTTYVILVPFLCWWLEKEKPKEAQIFAALAALAGIALLSLEGSLRIQTGDFLTLVCGGMLSFHILFIDRYTGKTDPILLTLLQFFFAGIYSWGMIGATGIPFPVQIWERELLLNLLYIGVGSTMLGFLLQIVCQKYTNPNVAAVLLSLESVFGMLFSVLFLHEVVTWRIFTGCVCMLAAVLLSEIKETSKTK